MGAWIETFQSAPTLSLWTVAPHVGAWIETTYKRNTDGNYAVAHHVGAWIETDTDNYYTEQIMSHPMWVRGLKPTPIFEGANDGIVAPHVGAWIETYLNSPNGFKLKVAPHVGAWIETVENRSAV